MNSVFPLLSQPVERGSPIRVEHHNHMVADMAALADYIARIETRLAGREAARCRTCLCETFLVGLFEVTADLGSSKYTCKPLYISNTGTTTDAITLADMASGNRKGNITATALGDGAVAVGDQFLVFGGYDNGSSTGEPIVRYFFESRGGEWIPTTLIKTSTGTPTYFDTNADLGIEYDTNGAMCAETRAFFRFPAAVNGLAAIGHIMLADAVMAKAPWEWQFSDDDFDAGADLECSWKILVAFVSASIGDTITWGSEPASGNEFTFAEIQNHYALVGATNTQFIHAGAGVDAWEAAFLDDAAGPDSTVYGLRFRVAADITHGDINYAAFGHDQSASSESLACWYRDPIA